MNNNNITYILDEPVPHIGLETLRPTPFRGIIQSLERYYDESSEYSEEKNGMSTTTG